MTLNWIGPMMADAFFSIWFGDVGVRKLEALSPTLWLPTLVALVLGLALGAGALFAKNIYWAGALGIVGMTALFDALEFTRRHNRVKHGHAPANPNNPRHARLLNESPSATPHNWLKREPMGHPVKLEATLPPAEIAK